MRFVLDIFRIHLKIQYTRQGQGPHFVKLEGGGGVAEYTGGLPFHGVISPCVLSLTESNYPVRPDYGDYPWCSQYQQDLSWGNIA